MTRRTAVDLRSRRGDADALGTLLAFPVWFALIGLFVAVTWWCWSLAVNEIAMVKASAADAVSADAEMARRVQIYAGLGQHGGAYANSTHTVEEGRAIRRDIDTQNTIVRWTYRVSVRVLTRIEKFYARPPVEDWE